MTSSGRRVKRKNLDEYDENSFRNINRNRKSKNDRKASRKKKSSLSKSLRPQRAAARNALNLFSQITGTSTDGEDQEDGSEGDSSESESTLQDSNIGSEESDVSLQAEQNEHSKGKEVVLYESEDAVKPHESPESRPSIGNRRRLVLKLPNRDSSKLVENTLLKCGSQPEVGGTSSTVPQGTDKVNTNFPHWNGENIEESEKGQISKVENHIDLLEGYNDGKIKWGGVRTRTSKRFRVGEPLTSGAEAGLVSCFSSLVKIENFVNEKSVSEKNGTFSASSEIQANEGKVDEMVNGFMAGAQEDSDECKYDDKSPNRFHNDIDDRPTSSVPYNNGVDKPSELKGNTSPVPTKLRIRSKTLLSGRQTPTKIRFKSSVQDSRNGVFDVLTASPPEMEKNLNSEVPDYKGTEGPSSGGGHGGVSEEAQIDGTSGSGLPPNNKMYNAVYRRSKSFRARRSLEANNGGMEASTSNAGNLNVDEETEATTEGIRRTRSMGFGSTTRNLSVGGNNVELRAIDDGSEDTSTSVERSSIKASDEIHCEGWRSSSRVTVGVRSTRNRRSSYHAHESSTPDKRKSNQSARSSWLMLTMHEGGPRYIPQRGDEVAYFIQVRTQLTSVCLSLSVRFFLRFINVLNSAWQKAGGERWV